MGREMAFEREVRAERIDQLASDGGSSSSGRTSSFRLSGTAVDSGAAAGQPLSTNGTGSLQASQGERAGAAQDEACSVPPATVRS